jgi:lipoprotein-anchoring transpeptidase ErfK/SrfK
LNWALVLRTFAAILAAAGLACAAAPASEPTIVIPAGVTVAGVQVGGLSAEPARAAIDAAFTRPVTIAYGGRQTIIAPAQIGAGVDADAAVGSALAATPHSRIALPVTYSSARAARIVDNLADRVDRPPVAAQVIGATEAGPEFTAAKPGVAVDVDAMREALPRLLMDVTRAPLQLITRPRPAQRTIAHFGPVIVVTRAANTLRLYNGRKLVRTFPVATGPASYPTPAGVWRILNKQRDPWWYPPTYDAWAKGLKPVPPGPSNPLGTRWMGLNAPGVGIHGTDAPTSIGYSASHGCVRMQVPDAEWLFEHVRVGTPVVIL